MKPNPARLEAVYTFILAYKTDHDGAWPTIRQIQTAASLPSSSQVSGYLAALARQGKLERIPGTRLWRVVGGRWEIR